MDQVVKQAIEEMRRKGFEVVEMETAADAKRYLTEQIGAGQSVGLGGSVTIRDLDVLPALKAKGCAVCDAWTAKTKREAWDAARMADVYLSSANAVTNTGSLVFIDGSCNRVGAIADGPATVLFVISQAKFVDGGIHTATARIKRVACPRNARRLGLHTPCAETGVCREPECGDDCMCRIVMTVDRVPHGRRMVVLVVEEALGY